MLKLTVVLDEVYDERTETFEPGNTVDLKLQHSLVSLSKWEAIHKKPFLSTELTPEMTISYIRCMSVGGVIAEATLAKLSESNFAAIQEHILDHATATWFSDDRSGPQRREIITAELIYYWIVSFNIPFEVQTWHLNRLLTLIRVFSEKNKPPKKMSAAETMRQNRELNAARQRQAGTSG